MKQSKRLLFFGNEQITSGFKPHDSPTLQRLIDNGYDVVGVILQSRPSTSRKSSQFGTQQIAMSNGIAVFTPSSNKELIEIVKNLQPEIGVLVSYGRIIPESVINLFKFGIINIHPSLLPHYRGSTPIEQAILDGRQQTGVSVMKLVKKMDAGPILAQKNVAITSQDDKLSLASKLLEVGGATLIEVLPSILDGSISEKPQDDSKATFTSQISKSDGNLDANSLAEDLIKKIKAYKVWPGSKITLKLPSGKLLTLIIEEANKTDIEKPVGHVSFDQNKLIIGTKTNAIELSKVKIPGKKPITGKEFASGYIKNNNS